MHSFKATHLGEIPSIWYEPQSTHILFVGLQRKPEPSPYARVLGTFSNLLA